MKKQLRELAENGIVTGRYITLNVVGWVKVNTQVASDSICAIAKVMEYSGGKVTIETTNARSYLTESSLPFLSHRYLMRKINDFLCRSLLLYGSCHFSRVS